METRRDFLKKTGILLGGAALLGVTGCNASTGEPEVPAYPYPCCEFDLDRVEKLAYEGYYENGCCYGVAYALLTELKEKVGYPFTVIPAEMFANGKEGYVNASLCGAMGGALGVFGLVLGPDDARAVTKQLNDWYVSTPPSDLPARNHRSRTDRFSHHQLPRFRFSLHERSRR